jgi:hypothetical protein
MKNNNKNSQVIKFLKSNGFGSSFLIAIVIFEGFFAFKLFILTGIYTFSALLLPVAMCYSFLMAGTIVFFSLRNNSTMVIIAVVFEVIMNFLLDVMSILLSQNDIPNRAWIFISMLLIGSILPLATKSFAEALDDKNEILEEPKNEDDLDKILESEVDTLNKRINARKAVLRRQKIDFDKDDFLSRLLQIRDSYKAPNVPVNKG